MDYFDQKTEYKQIVLEAKSYYECKPLELRNVKNGSEIFDFDWCDGLVNEINLWTYWQGAGVDNPEVMIIGQDFGSCNDEINKKFYRKCVSSTIRDIESISAEYIHRITKNKNNKTDNMLLELTEYGLGEKYSAGIPGNKYLFMTNLCLGYRSVNKISGGNLLTYLKHDSVYIAELIMIKKPKIVICLGMDTYYSLISAFIDDKKILKDIVKDFWKSLNEGNNYYLIRQDSYEFRIYGVSHAGSNGAMNRKKNCIFESSQNLSGQELMMDDWKKIGLYLNS